jgi:AcrR family transcriptional regulator
VVSVLDKRSRDDPRRRATERAFLDAAGELLAEGASFADLNVSRIADRARRTRTAFYVHFEDRRELLLKLIEEAAGPALASVEHFFSGAAPEEHDQLVESLSGLLRAFRASAPLVRAVVEAAGYDDVVATYWADQVIGRLIVVAGRWLREHGHGESESLPIATALIWMTERTCYQQAIQGGTGLDDQTAIAGLSKVWWSVLPTAR